MIECRSENIGVVVSCYPRTLYIRTFLKTQKVFPSFVPRLSYSVREKMLGNRFRFRSMDPLSMLTEKQFVGTPRHMGAEPIAFLDLCWVLRVGNRLRFHPMDPLSMLAEKQFVGTPRHIGAEPRDF